METNLLIECEVNGIQVPSFHFKETELVACYRALTNLRNLLFQEHMLELLQDQIDEGTKYFESLLAASNHQYTESATHMTVNGLSAREFRSMTGRWYKTQPLDWMAFRYVFPAHPAVYTVLCETDKNTEYEALGKVQMIGDHMAKLWVVDPTRSLEIIPEWLTALHNPRYEMKDYSIVKLDSGSVFFYLMNEFTETEDGCKIRLRAFFPSASPASLVSQYALHQAIDYRNLLCMVQTVVEAEQDSY
ncbi:uncharacterized protein N7511_000098 [Penicillium nucicola]|uniref:uncharacterized protein n=1 Tax=Penicillium nucicola TaxID=1850975 RepID=UPI00254590C3|nr:uncharacterized protein N7511_000098 [Penicillium nucicola]KAJ5775087.1 hypothetical protein N7511_000098 [Penicillium nucicola]